MIVVDKEEEGASSQSRTGRAQRWQKTSYAERVGDHAAVCPWLSQYRARRETPMKQIRPPRWASHSTVQELEENLQFHFELVCCSPTVFPFIIT